MSEVKFEDTDSYTSNYGSDKISFREIILHHLRAISSFASVEFRGGYWQIKNTPSLSGGVITTEIYVSDSREVYSNAVECFADMLFPYFDSEMLEAEAIAKSRLTKTFNDKTIIKVSDREDNSKDRLFESDEEKISFRTVKREINRDLFRALCSFLYRKKYLELGSIED